MTNSFRLTPGKLAFNYAETGRALHLSRYHVLRLIERKDLQTVQMGQRTLVTRRSLQAYLQRLAPDDEVEEPAPPAIAAAAA